jgi:hypothetical protein
MKQSQLLSLFKGKQIVRLKKHQLSSLTFITKTYHTYVCTKWVESVKE